MPVLATALYKACKRIKKAKRGVVHSRRKRTGSRRTCLLGRSGRATRDEACSRHSKAAKQQTAAASGRRAVGGVGWVGLPRLSGRCFSALRAGGRKVMRRGYLLTRRISRFLPARISARADGGWSCRGAGETVRLKHSSHHDTADPRVAVTPPLGLSRGSRTGCLARVALHVCATCHGLRNISHINPSESVIASDALLA